MPPEPTLVGAAPVVNEVWNPIPGYEGWYEVSSMGSVRRVMPGPATRTGRLSTPIRTPQGYLTVHLCRNGHQKRFPIHRLVARAFLGEQPSLQVNHKNGIKTDNRLENLEWVTAKENARHSVDVLGKAPGRDGANLQEHEVVEIRAMIGAGEEATVIAARFGVSRATVQDIKRLRTWRHLGPIVGAVTKPRRLSAEKAALIRAALESGETQREVAARYGVSQVCVSKIKRGIFYRQAESNYRRLVEAALRK